MTEKQKSLICRTTITHFKASNLKHHHETNHKKFASEFSPESELRRNKIQLLKSNLVTQENSLFSFCKQSDLATEASFAIARNIARSKRPYSHGEFVKKNISGVIAILAPENSKLK
jgi:hypothetical protein